MAEKFSVPSTGANGPGVIPFTIGPGGKLAIATAEPAAPMPTTGAVPTAPPAVETAPAATPAEPAPPPTPFARMYPGVDPTKVEMVLDDKTRKLSFRPLPEPTEVQPQAEEPPAPIVPSSPVAPPADEIAQLRAEIKERDRLVEGMLIAQASGKPLSEVLGITPPSQPQVDYSKYDLYDDAQKAEFVNQIRQEALQTARAEVQAAIQPHQAALGSARHLQEYNAVKARSASDPDFDRKAALTTQLIQGNSNISFEATYNLVSQIQQSLGANAAPKAAPANGANQARQTTLTPEQADAKAAQAARLPQSSGVKAASGQYQLPESVKDFKTAARLVAYQMALGNIQPVEPRGR